MCSLNEISFGKTAETPAGCAAEFFDCTAAALSQEVIPPPSSAAPANARTAGFQMCGLFANSWRRMVADDGMSEKERSRAEQSDRGDYGGNSRYLSRDRHFPG